MASQIYSRYIPPSKKPSAPILPTSKAPPAPVPADSFIATPPPTRKDASATYTRYVPPAKTKAELNTLSVLSTVPSNSSLKRDREEPVDAPSPKRTKQDKSGKKSRKARDATPKETELQKEVECVEASKLDRSVESAEARKSTKKVKRKRDPAGPAEVSGAGSVPEPHDDDAHGSATISKKDKGKKEKPLATTEDGDVEQNDEHGRHKRLMEKRQKSLRKAKKVAQQTGKESTGEVAPEAPAEVHDLVPLPQPDPVPEAILVSTTASLPPWLASPIRVLPTATSPFSELGIADEVAKVLQKRGFNEAFAVQGAVLPLLLPRNQQPGDVLVSAATGSGKTLAYVLPMVQDISRSQTTKLRGLIVMPTRELVSQAREICEICASAFPRKLRIGTAVGNDTLKVEQDMLIDQELVYDPAAYRNQQARLDRKWDSAGSGDELCDEELVSDLPDHVFCSVSKVDLLICTPGRLVEHVKSTPGFTLEHMKWLVVDEADKLLDQSFQQWLEVVMAGIGHARKVILSATMTRDIGLLNPLKLYRPKLVVLEGLESSEGEKHILPSLLLESAVKVEDGDIKPLYLMELLKKEGLLSTIDESSSESSEEESFSDTSDTSESPVHEPRTKGVLIFTKSNESAVRLGRLIALLSPSSSSRIGTLTSTTPRASRNATLRSFPGKVSILVASDLVSRGLDLPNLAHVVNYDVPTSLTSYVHRIGRTARAGKNGHAWTLYTPTEGRWFWNEIGRGGVERSAKVARATIEVGEWDYQDALEALGREAHGQST